MISSKEVIERLNSINTFKVHSIYSEEFNQFGRVIKGYDTKEILNIANEYTKVPEEGNIYVASLDKLQGLDISKIISKNIYGDMEIQVGYCNGNSSSLNALEYHKSPEVTIAVTPLVLFLAHFKDIQENKLKSSKVKAFYIEEGTMIELFPTTLHFAPAKVSESGFKAIIILPKGTNEDIELNSIARITNEDELLFKKNKWIIVHKDRQDLIANGAKEGIIGENYSLNYK